MGAVFAIVFLISMLISGIVCVIISSGFLLMLRKTTGKKMSKILFWILFIFGLICCLVPIGYFGFIVYINSVPPPDYVETEIVIEEDGYQDTRFTADGTVYETLNLEANYDVCYEMSIPVFSYKTEGFMNGSQCGNYYRIENGQGAVLILDEYSGIFCSKESKDQIQSYYEECGSIWYYCYDYDLETGEESRKEVTAQAAKSLETITQSNIFQWPVKAVSLDSLEEFSVLEVSEDNIVVRGYYNFIILENKVCIVDGTSPYENKVIELPEEVGEPLKNVFTDNDL